MPGRPRPFFFESDAATFSSVRRRSSARQFREQVSLGLNEGHAKLLAAYRNLYPDADSRVLVPLALQGFDPASEEVQKIVLMDVDEKRNKGLFSRIGDVVGAAGRTVGKVTAPVGRFLDSSLGDVDETLGAAARGTARTAFAVVETGQQELANVFRAGLYTATQGGDFLNNLQRSGSSTGREAIDALLEGEDVELGHGFLPGHDSPIAQEVRRKAGQLEMTINGVSFGGENPAITPGRILASTVSEPGETPFNILSGLTDAAIAWGLDPAAAVGTVYRGARGGERVARAGRALRDADLAGVGRALATNPGFAPVVDRSFQGRAVERVTGAIRAHRNTVIPELTETWLEKGGAATIARIATEADPVRLYEALSRKVPMQTVKQLAGADTPQKVTDILRPMLGKELHSAPEFLGYKARRATHVQSRLRGAMPGRSFDPDDLDDAYKQVEASLTNFQVSDATKHWALTRLVNNTNRQTMIATMSEIMGRVAEEITPKVKGNKVHRTAAARAKALTRMFYGDTDKLRAYLSDEIVENRKLAGVAVGDDIVDITAQTPFAYLEHLNSRVSLPDAREVRRATSDLARLVDNPFFAKTTGVLDTLNGRWKQLQLARAAYTVRVVGEEQVRLSAAGLDSMFAHPFSYIASLIGGDSRLGKALGTGKYRQLDVAGRRFDDPLAAQLEYQAGLSRQASDLTGTADRMTDHHVLLRPGQQGFDEAWLTSLSLIARDPVWSKVVEGRGNLDEVKAWFTRGPGQKFRKELGESHPELLTNGGADAYIDALWEGAQYRTGGNTLLMHALATGYVDGQRIASGVGRQFKWHDDFVALLDDTTPPAHVVGQVAREGVNARLDQAATWLFDHLMTRPTNYLSRSQAFRQFYWQRIEEMVPYMDEATRAKALRNAAAEGGADAKQLARLQAAASNGTDRIALLDDADLLAKKHALNKTKELLYDLSERGQFFDTHRLIFPFGEAWKEVITRWGHIGLENPRALRRGQQIIVAAREGNPFNPALDAQGFFHKDSEGNEVFSYPGSAWIGKQLTGIPIPLAGRVSGLSMMTEVLPGVGPVVQISAGAILGDSPDWEWLNDWISPYGSPDYSEGVLESSLPGFARKLRTWAQGNERAQASSTMAAMTYLLSTGKYDQENPADMQQMVEDAKAIGRSVFFFLGAAQFVSPTSPMPQWMLKAMGTEGPEGGKLIEQRVVQDKFYEMLDEGAKAGITYDEVVTDFLEMFGEDAILAMQPKSVSTAAPSLPYSKEASEWERRNAGFVKSHPLTWGLFAASTLEGDDAENDMDALKRQFARGERQQLKPEQFLRLGQRRIGYMLLNRAKATIGDKPTPAQQEWLAYVRERIRMEFPGFDEDVPGLPVKAPIEQVVSELRGVLTTGRMDGTPQAEAARLYLRAREKAYQTALERYDATTLDGQAVLHIRRWLATVGAEIVKKYPSFADFYNAVFAKEVR